jgi:surfactin synthase thioesterase subunit/acyl carrier protein
MDMTPINLPVVNSKLPTLQAFEDIQAWLASKLAGVLEVEKDDIDFKAPFDTYDIDSTDALILLSELEEFLGFTISPAVIWTYPNIQSLSQRLAEEFLERQSTSTESIEAEKDSAPTNTKSRWFPNIESYSQAQMRLFCFPYSGAGASLFRDWSQAVRPNLQVCPVQLPGREERIEESPVEQLTFLIEELIAELQAFLDMPFAFFGHSFGALVSFELARTLRRKNLPQPIHLFASGSPAPQTPIPVMSIHQLPDDEFAETLRQLGGTPESILKNPEFARVYLPPLRADIKILETYVYNTESPLDSPITVFSGKQDSLVSQNDASAWRDQTLGKFDIQLYAGDHFFLHKNFATLLNKIQSDLTSP